MILIVRVEGEREAPNIQERPIGVEGKISASYHKIRNAVFVRSTRESQTGNVVPY